MSNTMADPAAVGALDKVNGKPESKNGPTPTANAGKEHTGTAILSTRRSSTTPISATTEAPVSNQAQTATKNLLDTASGRLRVSELNYTVASFYQLYHGYVCFIVPTFLHFSRLRLPPAKLSPS